MKKNKAKCGKKMKYAEYGEIIPQNNQFINPWQQVNLNQQFQVPSVQPIQMSPYQMNQGLVPQQINPNANQPGQTDNNQSQSNKLGYRDIVPNGNPFTMSYQEGRDARSKIREKAGTSTGMKIATGVLDAASVAGEFASGIIRSLPALGAFIPNNQNNEDTIRPIIPRAYNPYPSGTGSQAIYEDGGYVTNTRKKRGITVTEEAPIEMFQPSQIDNMTQMTPLQSNMPSHINQPFMGMVPVPQVKKSIGYDKIYDNSGNVESYAPNFSAGYDYNSAIQDAMLLPEQIGGIPVQRSKSQLAELYQNFMPNSTAGQWKPFGKYENGGIVNDPTYDAISSVLMNRNKDKNFVQRAYNPKQYPSINNHDGTFSTHKMAYDTNDDGTASVYPTIIQDKSGKLIELNSDQAYDYSRETGEYINTPSYKTADYLSRVGYKTSTGMLKKENGGEIAKSGIHIKPENKGKFTAAANRAHMGVQEYARKVLNDPNASPTLKKRANFARNFGGKKANGGYVAGQEYEVDNNTYNMLISMGYDIERL